MNALSLFSLALAPGAAIILFIYLKDKHEREPFGLLFLSFLYGGLSTLVTMMISWPVNLLILTPEEDVMQQFFNAFFKVALIEEFSKFIFVRFILYYNKNFNEPFDGIVYAVMVGMGFATVENVIYVFQYGFATGFLRMFTAVPAHAAFAIIMGYFLGKAKFTHRREIYFSVIALLAPTLFHGTYDYFWFISFVPGIWTGALLSLAAGFILARKAIRLHQQASPFIKQENKLIPEEKKPDVSAQMNNDNL
ncbi:MAG: PrsW family glutamic-type intramembrane protease [Cyclobacteriaceae bacterium]|jgi:RsiW-degrading membrane proteinase PrsW (M82 family)|nr:PrsW family glutamic-type intramembrane protease [Cyclobacteriaceae bacterium]MDH4298222.1 PrsW family glutamic-type intramembrane protease [Cyclobacteriaceae bacterium]MDH5249724.1 PrsW family glutamic-type intramembrane protease [Cyclobacteriaceae bacterium]